MSQHRLAAPTPPLSDSLWQSTVSQAAAQTPQLLLTCTSLLLSPSAIVYANNIESVLLKIGLHSAEMGLCLSDQLLRNSVSSAGAEEQAGKLREKFDWNSKCETGIYEALMTHFLDDWKNLDCNLYLVV